MSGQLKLDFLPERTAEVLKRLNEFKFISAYVLVGGTALSLQIRHRLSEDLVFFYHGEELKIETIKRNILKAFPESRIIRQDYRWQIDYIINQVKVTFFSTGAVAVPFNITEHTQTYGFLNIAKPTAIAALKFSAIAQRNTIRDYYDLYFLAKHHTPLDQLIEFSKKYLPNLSPVTYIETIVYTKDIEEDSIAEHLTPVEKVDKELMAEFFKGELIRIRDRI